MNIVDVLGKHKADGFIMINNAINADFFYATNFFVLDDCTYIQTSSGKEIFLLSEMEKGRAQIESRIKNIKTLQELGFREKIKSGINPDQAFIDCICDIFKKENIKKIAVPRDFSYYIAQKFKEVGFSVIDIKNPFIKLREVKSENEIEYIKFTQKACEKAMQAAINLIETSEIMDGKLLHRGFEITADDIRKKIDIALLESGCDAKGTIVACGTQAANVHSEGEGPLEPHQPIVIDIFPQHKKSHYCADMSRTVIKGNPSEKIQKMYDTVLEAQNEAINMIKPGILCSAIHNKVCDVFEAKGYKTIREGSTVGFIHSTGHGVGLDIHESPTIGTQDNVLEKGNIITIEPGLYSPEYGGIRIEDLILVTEDGHENLTKFEKRFVLQ